jgi:hypothetical protein
MEWFVWVYRQYFCCKRRVQKFLLVEDEPLTIEVPTNRLPWFWIGARVGDKTHTVTEMINQHVRYNQKIDPSFLKGVTGFENAEWLYMDTVTLEEKEFPSAGIVIDGPPDQGVLSS